MEKIEIYKFKDTVDGRYAFILDKSKQEAMEALSKQTSLPYSFIESKPPEDLKHPIILINQMLPF